MKLIIKAGNRIFFCLGYDSLDNGRCRIVLNDNTQPANYYADRGIMGTDTDTIKVDSVIYAGEDWPSWSLGKTFAQAEKHIMDKLNAKI